MEETVARGQGYGEGFSTKYAGNRKDGIVGAVFTVTMNGSMKTTIDIPDDLFRLAKARASLNGISLRQFVTDTLRAQLEDEEKRAQLTDPPWMKGFGGLADLAAETARIRNLIEEEFESIDPESET